MSSQPVSPKTDFFLALVLWAILLPVLIESIRLTFFIELPGFESGKWSLAPGMLPLFLSGGLLIMLTLVLAHNIRLGALDSAIDRTLNKAHKSSRLSEAIDWCRQPVQIQRMLQASVLLIYVFIAVGRIPFALATGLYLFTSLTLARSAKLHWILLISVATPLVITWVFGSLMKLPLP